MLLCIGVCGVLLVSLGVIVLLCVFVGCVIVLWVVCLVCFQSWLYVNSVGIRYSEFIHICCFV